MWAVGSGAPYRKVERLVQLSVHPLREQPRKMEGAAEQVEAVGAKQRREEVLACGVPHLRVDGAVALYSATLLQERQCGARLEVLVHLGVVSSSE